MDYLRDPAAIYARSFATIRSEADLLALPAGAQDIAIRIIHACGMAEIAPDLRITDDFAAAAGAALSAGRPILADCEMVRHGIVGAAESKAELAGNPRGIPFATLLGRRGGSAMAAAAVNAVIRGLS